MDGGSPWNYVSSRTRKNNQRENKYVNKYIDTHSFTYEISLDSETVPLKMFTDIKIELDEVKNKMDKMDQNTLNQKLRHADPFSKTKKIIEQKLNAENVSNAWIKMMQMLNSFQLIKNSDSKIFCNAELPGAFIFAINHYCYSHFGKMIEWYASSLIGESDVSLNYLDDQYCLAKNHPNRWLMNSSMNGDVTVPANRKYVHEKLGGTIDLYTSDLGFAVKNFNEQEREHIIAHIGAALMGIESLKVGGSMILKMYTFFEPETLNFLSSIIPLFEKFYIHKPAASRITNSEIYIVCINLLSLQNFSSIEKLSTPKNKITSISSDFYNAAKNIYSTQITELEKVYKSNLSSPHRAANITSILKSLKKLPNEKKLGKKC